VGVHPVVTTYISPDATAPYPAVHDPECAALFGAVRVFDINLHSRMPLVHTPARLKLEHACDQWHSSRTFTPSCRLTQ
jgi:hypothetical protein